MIETLYRKEQRGKSHRYVPVAHYDSVVFDAMAPGCHLVVVHPGGRTTAYNVDPDYAAISAGFVSCQQELGDVLQKATTLEPARKMTPKEQKAWAEYQRATGNTSLVLSRKSIYETLQELRSVVEARIKP